jgi:HK97 family phage major capsid protein
MAAVYGDIISRASSGSDALVPEPLSNEIFQELPRKSAALSLMAHMPLSAKTQRIPVLDMLPLAYFVSGDTGMKQTAQQAWKGVQLVVEEIATIVPIPEAYLADADVDVWAQVQPRMIEAVGALIDAAVFWDVAKPSTWGQSIFDGAVSSGNVVVDGFLDSAGTESADDFGQSVTALGDLMSQTGYDVTGFATRPGLNWRLAGLRSEQGVPIYQPDMTASPTGKGLYGYALADVNNGSWEASKAQLITGDWTKAVIGLRQDISFKLFDSGVISNDSGAVVLNLMQQDAVAMRLTLRMAFAVANPVTIMQPNDTIDGAGGTTQRWPFGVIAASASIPG